MARQQDKRPEYAVTLYPDELEAAGHDRRTAEEAHSYMMDRGAKCLRCPLFGLRHGPVRSELRPGAPLLVCGDVPEQDDVDAKQPFVGRAGLMLGEAVWEGGIAREEASFVNAISCRPPEEYNAYAARVRIEYEKRVKDAEEAGLPAPPVVLMPEEACHPRLMTDIAEAKPVVALALGVAAVKAVAAAYDVPYGAKGRKARVGEAKISSLKRVLGSPVCPPGKPVIVATYHPAWTARQGNKHYGHIVHGHIAKAARIAARGGSLDWKDADITTLDPTIEQVRETFARFVAHDAPVYCDIETDSAMARTATLRCIGYGQLRADGLWEVIVVPFRRIDGTAFWSPEDEAVLRAECLAFHKQVKLVGHNFVMFDSEKLLREGLLDDWAQSFGDSMLRHRNTVANDAPHSLGFCISQYTEAPAHKDDANDKYLDGGADDTALHGYCLNALTRVRLADGTTDTIRRLLKRQGPIDVLSLNLRTHKIESRRVTRFYRTDAPGQMWVEVKHARQLPHHTGAITTPEHEWYTDRGWVRADKLVPGDRVCTAELRGGHPLMVEVSHVGPAVPIEGPNVRYCLDVEGNHNFFTTSGLVHNCAKDVHRTGIVDVSLREENAACGTEEAYKTDFDTAPVYRNMGDLGMVIDMAKHREMWIKFEGQRRALIKRAQDVVGNDKFNPNAPDQVRDFLYRKKGLIPVISTQKGKEWRPGDDPSTNANALQQLILKRALDEQTTQFIDALSKYRAVSKVVGSYIEGLVKDRTPKADLTDEDEEDIKGAPDPAKDLEAYIDWRYARIGEATNTTITREQYPELGELFMLHPQYKMHIPTGRVSTSPSIQNWPSIGVANMRELGIVPRGYKFVGADFEQIELRLYAVIADDQVVLEAFHADLDVHTLNYATLRARNPSDTDEVMRIYHETMAHKKRGEEGDKKAKDAVKAWRTLAKRFVYLICYGGETDRLFATMSTDRDKATGDLLFKGLTPQQVSIMYNNWHTVHPWTIQWQEREVAHAKQHGWIQAILDARKRHFPGGLNKRNAAPNAKIQGSAAAITNRAVKILGDLIRHREWGIMSGLNLQIHDYIGAYVPAARADEAARMIQESMETTYMGMPFPAVPVISESWATQ